MTAPTEAPPIVPPPAGAWIRERLLPATFPRAAPRLLPEWVGAWHVATGDLSRSFRGDMSSKVRCGHSVRVRAFRWDGWALGDFVVADELPTVDVCLRCLRLSGAPATVRVEPRRVTVEPTTA